MSGIYTLKTKADAISAIGDSNDIALVSQVDRLSKTVISVPTLAALPSASENTGRFIFVESVLGYRYSGGFTWTNYGDSENYTTNSFTLWTWGYNLYGQLGDNNGTVTSRSSPVSVVGGFIWKQVSAGSYHTTAIKSDDTLWSWGRNNYGQLGDNNGTVTTRSSPVSVVGGFIWKQVSAGSFHTAAIKSDSTLWSWGRNNMGQLGDNTVVNKSSPVSVIGGLTWKQVGCGAYHTAAIKSDDTLWAWGVNDYGQLGDNNGTVQSRSSPVSVVGGFTWKQVSAGYHTAAIKSDDTLWAWGRNTSGVLGDNNGTVSSRSSPVSVVGGFTWKQMSAGGLHVAAITWAKGFV